MNVKQINESNRFVASNRTLFNFLKWLIFKTLTGQTGSWFYKPARESELVRAVMFHMNVTVNSYGIFHFTLVVER